MHTDARIGEGFRRPVGVRLDTRIAFTDGTDLQRIGADKRMGRTPCSSVGVRLDTRIPFTDGTDLVFQSRGLYLLGLI